MPRQTNDEYLASLEAELAETRRKAEETIQAKIAATQAKLDAAKAKGESRKQDRITKLDEQIATAKASLAKTEERISKLQLERDELVGQTEAPASDEQVDDERTEQPSLVEAGKGNRRAKPDAA